MPVVPRIAVVSAVALAAVSCSSSSRLPPSGVPTCSFKIGDSIIRGTVGADVPPLGRSVTGNGDGTYGSESIGISTSSNGVVTISYSKDGEDPAKESCALP